MFTLRRIVLSVLVSGALVMLAVGFNLARDEDEDGPRFVVSAVEALIPPAGALDVRQARIGVDLVDGYDAALIIDGIEIPKDQLQRVDGLNQIFFTPGPETETGALEPGLHRAVAVVWPLNSSRASAGKSIEWDFNVH
jgi:hypothetical protein